MRINDYDRDLDITNAYQIIAKHDQIAVVDTYDKSYDPINPLSDPKPIMGSWTIDQSRVPDSDKERNQMIQKATRLSTLLNKSTYLPHQSITI